ncbi:MAG: YtxH domain-containing protein [Chitinophagaceae bacterium]|nr:YtxH domain-containing protein [Chitinophagaceae bacterium]
MKNTSKVLIALGAGVAIGGILGVLFAPDKGSVTRQKIAESPQKLADKFKSKIKIGKEKTDEVLDKINDRVEELV